MSRLVEAGEALAAALADPANDSSAAVASWRDAVARCAHDGQSAKARAQARRADKAAALRVSSAASARESLAGIAEGLEVDCLTFGQFSLIDALEAILEVTGPAEVVCATWTAAPPETPLTPPRIADRAPVAARRRRAAQRTDPPALGAHRALEDLR